MDMFLFACEEILQTLLFNVYTVYAQLAHWSLVIFFFLRYSFAMYGAQSVFELKILFQ